MSFKPKTKNTVNLKKSPFIVIKLLHEGLTHIHSEKKKAQVAFCWEFHIKNVKLPQKEIMLKPLTYAETYTANCELFL